MKKDQLTRHPQVFSSALALLVSSLIWSCGSNSSSDSGGTPPSANASPVTAEEGLKLVQTYCVSCHGDKAQKGGVKLSTQDEVKAKAEKSIDEINESAMPPAKAKQPSADEKTKLLSYLKSL
jgi:mono/diheme cytochrome c family protein